MSDDFAVNNPAVRELNDALSKAVFDSSGIIDHLAGVLANMAAATQNSAIPLWDDLTKQWGAAYNDLVQRLNSASGAYQNAHEAYLFGDRQSVAVMT